MSAPKSMAKSAPSNILHRRLAEDYPCVGAAKGLWVQDTAGRWYLDACSGGAAVSCIGHGDDTVAAAIADQLRKNAFFHNSFFSSESAEELAATLTEGAPESIRRVSFCSGGSEAMEGAIKLARQYHLEKGHPRKTRVIARRQSYHGATLGALSVSGNVLRREFYEPFLFEAALVSACYEYRGRNATESARQYGRRMADELEAAILRCGPDTVAAFVAEPVVGATLGAAPAVAGYLQRVREICTRHDVQLILDEVMCGLGRTGWRHACLEDGVSPDLMTVAKGLGGGYQPIGAILVGEPVVQALECGSGAFRHGFTYMGHPVACAAALAVQKAIHEHDLVTNVRKQGRALRKLLLERFRDHPHVGDIRGRGLLVGVELVADRATRESFEPELAVHTQLKRAMMQRGLLAYPGGGTVDGRRGDHVLFAPAYTVTAEQVAMIVERFALALEDVVSGVVGARTR